MISNIRSGKMKTSLYKNSCPVIINSVLIVLQDLCIEIHSRLAKAKVVSH